MPDTNHPAGALLAGRRVLVTGAARGLGAAFAESAARAGARVVLADILVQRGQDTAEQLRAQGLVADFVVVDLVDPASVQSCVQEACQVLGGLDGLINNAAVTDSGGKAFDELDPAVWDRVMQVNVRGTWLMTRAAAPHLAMSGKGSVVNLASDTALWGAPRLLAYVASKGAIIAMTRALARELGPQKITVNAVAPGLVQVEATEYVPAARHELYLQGRAIPREQVPEDVCGAVNFLLSDAARFVTGQLLPINGGFVFN